MYVSINQVIAGIFQPYDFESVTVADTAKALTASKYQDGANIDSNSKRGATRVVITVETAQLRYRYDGTDPTSAEGHILNINDVLVLVGPDAISRFRGIRTGGTSAVLKCTYER
jgi:hypothetical protein